MTQFSERSVINTLPGYNSSHYQSGAVLIVSLVMLTILTIIAVGTATDIGLQSNMARNSQISMNAFNTTLSELRAQFQASKANDNISDTSYQQLLSDVYQTEPTHTAATDELLMPSANNPFTQTFEITFIGYGHCGGGNEVGSTGLIYEFEGTAELDSTGIKSEQVMGVCYPNPQQ